MRKEKYLAVARAVLTALVILTGSIALPILLRPFYYLHIAPMDLGAGMNLTAEQIRTAYQEMMDYCIGLSDTFSVGVLPWSEDGAAHFADVRKLFLLDLRVLAVSGILLIVCSIRRKKTFLLGHTPPFWSAVGLGTAFALVGGLAALDFEKAFVIFHQLLFPGKSNWLFDMEADPIINLLPAEFFRNCALLILAGILLSCVILLFRDWQVRKK